MDGSKLVANDVLRAPRDTYFYIVLATVFEGSAPMVCFPGTSGTEVTVSFYSNSAIRGPHENSLSLTVKRRSMYSINEK